MRRLSFRTWFTVLALFAVSSTALAQKPTRGAPRQLASHAVAVASHEEVPQHMANTANNLVLVQRWTGTSMFGEAVVPKLIERVQGMQNSGGYIKLPAITKAAEMRGLLKDHFFKGEVPAEFEPWVADMELRARVLESVSTRGHINTNLIIRSQGSWHPDRGQRSVVTTDLGPGTLWKGDGQERQADTHDILVFRGHLDPNPLIHSSPSFTGLRLVTLLMDAP